MTYPDILALGDSLTAGYGLSASQSLPAQLQALLRKARPTATVHNAGVSGDTSAGGLARLGRVLAGQRRRPDLAVVALGANDLLRGIAPERMQQNLDGILTTLEQRGVPVLLAGMMAPPFLGSFAHRFNAVFPAVAKAHGVPLYPFLLDGVVGDPTLVLADGIHPNARAIGIVAQRMLPHVERALTAIERRAA